MESNWIVMELNHMAMEISSIVMIINQISMKKNTEYRLFNNTKQIFKNQKIGKELKEMAVKIIRLYNCPDSTMIEAADTLIALYIVDESEFLPIIL